MADIYVIGINGDDVTRQVVDILEPRPAAIVCSDFYKNILLKNIPSLNGSNWISVTPLKQCFELLEEALASGPALIITSGDPLFYGLGRLVTEMFPSRRIHFKPAVSTMQLCFSRFNLSWDDAEHISLHGRPLELLDQKYKNEKLFIFTDPKNSPQRIAQYLLKHRTDRELDDCIVHVGERLATSEEVLYSGTLRETAAATFSEPNCMILLNSHQKSVRDTSRLGLTEADLQHSRGLITKNEVRAAVLHSLKLPEHGVFWDIGAGSGSISIETARLFPGLSVYSIEKNETEIANIKSNRELYECGNISVIRGEAPDALSVLPPPDRVFIGGNGGRLREIIECVVKQMQHAAIVVATAVTEKTLRQAPQVFNEYGLDVHISRVEITRLSFPSLEETPFNPINIITARRARDNAE